MPRKGGNPFLSGYEEIFSGVRDGPDVQHERVQQIPLSELHPFEGHPFRVVDDEETVVPRANLAELERKVAVPNTRSRHSSIESPVSRERWM